MEDIFTIKLSNKIVIGYKNNQNFNIIKDKNNNSDFDSSVKLENEEIIDVSYIMKRINDGNFEEIVSNDIKLTCIDEIYKIEFLKTKTLYLLDDILIKFFEKLKLIVKNSINKPLNQAIIIFDNLSYEIQLIIHRAALLSDIKILNFLDLNKSIMNYLYYKKNHKDCTIVIIKIDNDIEISIYNERKKIFSQRIDKIDIDFKFLNEKEVIKEIKDGGEGFSEFKDYVNNLTLNSYGEKEKIDKIYVYINKDNNENLNEYFIFGALYSNQFPISKESIVKFNFLDYEQNYDIKKLIIFDRKYKIKQKKMKIFIDDDDIPYENCYYKNINFIFKDKNKIYNYTITIYYNQENIFNIKKDFNNQTSTEFIFYKNYPNITIDDKKYQIEIDEKFEKNSIFKRVNLINVTREKIKFNDEPLEYYNDYSFSINSTSKITEELLNTHVLFLVGKNFKILTIFNKNVFCDVIDDNLKNKILNYVKNVNINNLEKDYSIDSINILKTEQNEIFKLIQIFIKYRLVFSKYFKGNVKTFNELDEKILRICGKYLIFKNLFYIEKYNKIEFSDSNCNKYELIMNSLNEYVKKCKSIITDSVVLSKLFYTACSVAVDYISSSDIETTSSILFDLIDFNGNNIYKAANYNNIQLVINLTKKSFLYPYFLQFDSAFKASETIEYKNQGVITCMTSMITLNQIKLDLIKSLPKFGIRIFFNSKYLANTILNTDITIYNEKKIFGHFLSQDDLLNSNDINYIKRVALSYLQKHERFSHYKKYLNKTESNFLDSPRGIINYNEDTIFILASKLEPEKGEMGESLEYIMTNGNRSLIDNIFKIKNQNQNLKELFEIKYFLEESNEDLIKELKKIEGYNEEILNEKDDDSDNDENFNQIKRNQFENETHKKKLLDDDKNTPLFDEKNKNNSIINEDMEFEKMKLEMISAVSYKKYTFEKNTIQEYRIINGKLIPYNIKK